MSCTARFNTIVICSKGLLEEKDAIECFKVTLEKLNVTLNETSLFIEGREIGTVSLGERILISYSNDNKIYELIRSKFSEQSEIFRANYIHELERQKQIEALSKETSEKIRKNLENIDKKIKKSNIAQTRQQVDSCEALKLELVDAAKEKGYEIIENETEKGIQLQFIKIEY